MLEMSLTPPEERYEFTVECPVCGAELHEGEIVYERFNRKLKTYTIFACENCIEDFATYVEDL